MKNIRKGNDIHFIWSILNGAGEPYNLEGKDIDLYLEDLLGHRRPVSLLTVTGNILDFFFLGKDQAIYGKHSLILVENDGQEGMHTVDKVDAVNLVQHTIQEGGEDYCSHLQTETIELTSQTEIGMAGPPGEPAGFGEVTAEVDANVGTPSVTVTSSGPDTAKNFHFAFSNLKGDPFTYEDFTPEQIAALQKPATDAAADVATLERQVEDAETLRAQAEQGRVNAEASRVQAENGRVSAEEARVRQASSDHSQAGDDHSRAESDHTRAESDRASIADKVSQEEMAAALANKANINGTYKTMAVGLADNLAADNSMPAEYLFRKIPDSVAAGLAQLRMVKGKSLVWNQRAKDITEQNYVSGDSNVSISFASNKATITSATDNSVAKFTYLKDFTPVVGHKYYVSGNIDATHMTVGKASIAMRKPNNSADCSAAVDCGRTGRSSAIGTIVDANKFVLRVSNATPANEYAIFSDVFFIDLTLMFGAGNEPTTVAEFEALYNAHYYANNAGTIINNKAQKIVTVGFNQWDEEWETGTLDNNGLPVADSDKIRSKNFIPVLAGYTYYVGNKVPSNGLFCYDGNKNYIGAASRDSSYMCTPIPGTVFAKFRSVANYGGTYKGDICINFSNASLNGTYKPYEKHELELNLTTLTGKLNGEGESVVIAPDGLKSNGSNHDTGIVEHGYLTKVQVVVGMRDYESGDESDGTVTTDGTHTNYTLATPLVYVLDTPVYVGYETSGSTGTEKVLPEGVDTNGVPKTAPFVCEVSYPVDAVGFINSAPKNYQSQESMDTMLTALGTALGFTWSKTWDASNSKWTYIITPNA